MTIGIYRITVIRALFVATIALLAVVARQGYALDSTLTASMRAGLVGFICQDGGAWLRCTSLESSSCSQVAESIVDPCLSRVLGSVSAVTNEENAGTLSKGVSSCVNEGISAKYSAIRKSTPVCTELPAHLR